MRVAEMRKAGRGQIFKGLAGHGKEFGFYSSGVIRPDSKNCLPQRPRFHAKPERAAEWARLCTLTPRPRFKPKCFPLLIRFAYSKSV